MKKKTTQNARHLSLHSESAQLGRDVGAGIADAMLSHFSNREPTQSDDQISRLWDSDWKAISKNVSEAALQKIDKNHGKMLVLAEDQAFIAGFMAGLGLLNGCDVAASVDGDDPARAGRRR